MIQILMAVYNNQPYLQEQLDSILSQEGPEFSLFIRDDYSTDGSLELLKEYQKKYPEKIRLFLSIKNEGVKKNFSSLVQLANADYLMFSDGDDVWLPEKVKKTFEEMQHLENTYGKHLPLLIHTDLKVVDSSLNPKSDSFWYYSCLNPTHGNFLNRLLVSNVVTGCTLMINRRLLEKAKPFPQEMIMHDWWLGLVATTFGRIGYLSDATILYRQHGKNVLGAESLRSYRVIIKKCFFILTNNGLREICKKIWKIQLQGLVFYQRYCAEMGGRKARMTWDFVEMFYVGGLLGTRLFFENKFYKNTKLKNFLFFILIMTQSFFLKNIYNYGRFKK